MALLKKIALLVVVLGVYVAYESNKVYVSEGFENPNGYKLVVLGARALQKLVKLILIADLSHLLIIFKRPN